jgi:hypothetical protein
VTVSYVLLLGWLAVAAFRPSVLEEVPGWLAWFAEPSSGPAMLVVLAWGVLALVLCLRLRRTDAVNVPLFVSGWCVATAAPIAMAAYLPCPQGMPPVWSAVTSTLVMFFGNYDDPFGTQDCAHPAPLAVQVARLVAPTATLAGAAVVLTAVSRTQLDRLAARRAGTLTVLVDPDEDSVGLVEAVSRRDIPRHRTVVLAPDLEATAVRRARAAGALAIEVDVDDADRMSRLRIWSKADRVLLIAPDGTRNRRLAASLRPMLQLGPTQEGHRAGLVSVVARVDDPWQAESWRRAYIGDPDLVVDAIGVYEETADDIVREVLSDASVTRVVVCGSGPLGLALCAELSQRGRETEFVVGSAELPEVVLVAPDASGAAADHRLREERFASDPLRLSAQDLPLTLDAVGTVVASEPYRHGQTAVLVTEETSRLGTRLALRRPGLLVFEATPDTVGVQPAELGTTLHPFGLSLLSTRSKAEDSWERAARAVHERYRRTNPEATLSAFSWEELPREFYRDSNRRQVLTCLTSARAIGRSWAPTTPDDLSFDEAIMTGSDPAAKIAEGCARFGLSHEELTVMARHEHASWLDHHRQDGWRAGPRDDERRTHPSMVTWEALPEETRTRTEAGVVDTLFQLRALGHRSVPADPEWQPFERIGTVQATRLHEPLDWQTRSGETMRGEAGDWLVTDEPGGRRTVAAGRFEQTHVHVSGDTWRRTSEVQARPGREGETVVTREGEVAVSPGDWVVRDLAGLVWVVPGTHMDTAYRRLPR